MTLAQQMQTIVEVFSEKIISENPFAQTAAQGRLTEKQFVLYLRNLKWIFHHNSAYLQIAQARAENLGLKELADFYEAKFREEVNHEKWAEEDLKLRGAGATTSQSTEQEGPLPHDDSILPSTHRLIQYLDEIITINPTLFLSYIFFTEYFTVLVGPRFLNNLETKCGIPASTVSAIAKHVEADLPHSAEDMKAVTRLVKDPALAEPMIDALQGSMGRVNSFLAECVGHIQ